MKLQKGWGCVSVWLGSLHLQLIFSFPPHAHPFAFITFSSACTYAHACMRKRAGESPRLGQMRFFRQAQRSGLFFQDSAELRLCLRCQKPATQPHRRPLITALIRLQNGCLFSAVMLVFTWLQIQTQTQQKDTAKEVDSVHVKKGPHCIFQSSCRTN